MAVAQPVEKKAFFQREIELGNPFGDKPKEQFYNEFASLIDSGIDMRRAIRLIIDEQEKKRTKALLEEIEQRIVSGASLSEAMEISGHFSAYEFQSIRIGEETGRLRSVLISLAAYFGDKVKLKRQLVSVFTYPVFVLFITLGVLYFMLNSVVPMFEDVFKQFNQELPWLTQQIVWLSEHFSTFMMYFTGVSAVVVIYCYTQRKEDWFRKRSAAVVLKVPVFGPLIRKIYLARFCQSMALLMESRTPLIKALELVEQMIRFYPLEEAIQKARKEILAGNQLHTGLSHFSIIDKRLVSLIRIAEEINQLDKTFTRAAKQYNEDVEYRTKLMGTIIEPAIIVVIGLVVGLIMVAMYLPMFNLSNVIK